MVIIALLSRKAKSKSHLPALWLTEAEPFWKLYASPSSTPGPTTEAFHLRHCGLCCVVGQTVLSDAPLWFGNTSYKVTEVLNHLIVCTFDPVTTSIAGVFEVQ